MEDNKSFVAMDLVVALAIALKIKPKKLMNAFLYKRAEMQKYRKEIALEVVKNLGTIVKKNIK